ncbi:MAG: hypothetical protein IPF79_00360 [Ignavibacteria bacterium]|nr:hypothetical protein [Ignavibacteria bacterium]
MDTSLGTTSTPTFFIVGSNAANRIFTNFTEVSSMSAISTIGVRMVQQYDDTIPYLDIREALLSSDVGLQRIGAAAIRAASDAREVARKAGTAIIVTINGTVQAVDPDSPLLPDLTELLALADEIVPL